MLEALLKLGRSLPVISIFAEKAYTQLLIKDWIGTLREARLDDVLVSYEGEELDRKLEEKAQHEWVMKLEKWLREEDITVFDGTKNKAIEDMKNAMYLNVMDRKKNQ